MRRLLLVVLSRRRLSSGSGRPAAPVANATPPEAPAAPVETGLDETAINQSVNPCDDFYEYACGNWLKKTEIPADKAAWGRGFSVIDKHNETELHAILEAASKGQVQTQSRQAGRPLRQLHGRGGDRVVDDADGAQAAAQAR